LSLEFDVFGIVFLSATLSRQDCVQVDLHVSTEAQNQFLVFSFLLLFVPFAVKSSSWWFHWHFKLAYEITAMEWLEVPTRHYYFWLGSKASSSLN